jgi:hypothetical protein
MAETSFTVIDAGRVCETAATIVAPSVRLPPAALKSALGWELKPQGLCKDERCVPVAGRTDLVTDAGVDLAGLAELLSRPVAIDTDERVAYVGTSAGDRSAQLASLAAPDFTLPDLTGRRHSLSDHRGKKVFLVAYASW